MLPLLLLACAPAGRAQQLSLRTYTVRDGLAHGRVNCMLQDRRGYLWLGTWDGLSRFDGSRFVNYGTADGLPIPFVECLAEDSEGRLWVGTLGGGFARMRDLPAADGTKFESWHVAATPRADDVESLLFDASGRLWIGTGSGIYRTSNGTAGIVAERALELQQTDVVGAIDTSGCPVFFGSGACATARGDSLSRQPWALDPDAGAFVGALRRGDRMYVAREHQLLAGSPDAIATEWQRVPVPLPPSARITALAQGPSDSLWVGTTQGLLESDGSGWRCYGPQHGLPDDWIRCLFVDRDQGVWVGTHGGGVALLADRAAVRFGAGEGFTDCNVACVVETSDGRILASTDTGGIYEVLADRAERLPGPAADFANVHMRIACDHNADFWLGTDRGLWFCPGPVLDLARCRLLGNDDGLPGLPVCAEIHEDRDGRLWFGSSDLAVYRKEPGAAHWQRAVSLPSVGGFSPCRVLLDLDGDRTLIASFDQLWELDGTQCRELRLVADGLLRPRCLLQDRRGWTWIGTRLLGAFAMRPERDGGLLHVTSRQGLASDAVWSMAEDDRGRLYFGTARGISRFDPEKGGLSPFGSAVGAAGAVVNHLWCDHHNRLWAATSDGLVRIDLATPEREHAAPRIYLAHVQIDGRPLPLPENGSQAVGPLVFAPGQRNLQVEFVGLNLRGARPLRYQHQLLGVDADWSPATEMPMVQFANLSAGSYRLRVRALDGDGRCSVTPADLSFTVLRPFWQRAWFLTAAALLLAVLVVLWHRSRLQRAVATERLRTQIATDLHDEVGAGLAQIAILSEVARRQAEPTLAADLGELAQLARSLREAMSDIVWALARGHDTLADLVQRMRQLGNRLLEVDGTQVDFRAPGAPELDAVALSPEQQRQLWLWFKEALTNVARHAAAQRVDIELSVAGGHMRLRVCDDGVGCAATPASTGHGLVSMQSRSNRLGGSMRLRTGPNAGTAVELEVPLRPRRQQRPA